MKPGLKHLIPYLFLIVYPISLVHAQSHRIDSLKQVLKTEKEDTNKVNTLKLLSNQIGGLGDFELSTSYASDEQLLAEKLGFKKGLIDAYHNLGDNSWALGNLPSALEDYTKALNLAEEIGNKSGVANNLGGTANVYSDMKNYSKSLEYCFKALAIAREIGDNRRISVSLGNIGNNYFYLGDYAKALEYGIEAVNATQKIADSISRIQLYANSLDNIGNVYEAQGNYSLALNYYFQALNAANKTKQKFFIAGFSTDIGSVYTKEGKYKQAKEYFDSSLTLAKNIGSKGIIKDVYDKLVKLDSANDNLRAEVEDYKNYIIYRDSLINEATTKEEMNMEYEQRQAVKKTEQDKKDVQQRIITWSVFGGLLLVLLFSAFILRSLQITRRQKRNIEIKNKLIEQKNKDILDSITYAKRLQDAILPPLSVIKRHLPESFVLYKPKDIVAGDFYWMWSETTSRHSLSGENSNDSILIAACDCTGHGVPGAMVSVVCSNALNRTVKELKITEPGKILDKVRELVLETFEKSENNVQDGMDISIASLSPSKGGITIQWAGAHNPLWYIENGEMKEIMPDKQPIGKTDNPKPFTTHTVTFPPNQGNKEGLLYLFTDGYADQFGGPKGKKFKYKQLQQVITDNAQLTMEGQKNVLEKTLVEWRGSLDQVDDILIIGIRV